jgi:hypothetical protein
LIIRYLERAGRDATCHRDRLDAAVALQQADERERNSLELSDFFLPHEIRDEELQALLESLRKHPSVARAHLVLKAPTRPGADPVYVLIVWSRRALAKLILLWLTPVYLRVVLDGHFAKLQQRLVETLAFPGYTHVLLANTQPRAMRRKIEAVEASRIYG